MSKWTSESQFTRWKVLIDLKKDPSKNKWFRYRLQLNSSKNKWFRYRLQFCVFSVLVIGWWSKLRAVPLFPSQIWIYPCVIDSAFHRKTCKTYIAWWQFYRPCDFESFGHRDVDQALRYRRHHLLTLLFQQNRLGSEFLRLKFKHMFWIPTVYLIKLK